MPMMTPPLSPPRFRLPAAFSALALRDDPTSTGYLYHDVLGFNCVREGRLVTEMTVVHTTQRYVMSDVINTYAAGLSDISQHYTDNYYEVVEDSSCVGAYLVMVHTLLCEDTPINSRRRERAYGPHMLSNVVCDDANNHSNDVADRESAVEIQAIITGHDSHGFRFEEICCA